jgi:hypothetical protein
MKTAIDPTVPFGIATDIFFGDCDTPLPKPPDDYDDDESTPLAGKDREAMAAMLGFDPNEEDDEEDEEDNDDE